MNEMAIKVPRDIKHYVRMRVAMRLLACILGNAAIALILIFYKDRIAERSVSAQVLVYTIPFVLMFLATGVPLKLIDHTWCGTIENVKVKTVLAGDLNGFNHRRWENVIEMEVRLDSGKIIRYSPLKGYIGGQKSLDFYTDNFKTGDKVIHVYGTRFIQRLPDEESDTINCVICGEVQSKDHVKCESCEHSLNITECQDTASDIT